MAHRIAVLLPWLRAGLAGGLLAVASGCIVVPQTREVFDPECRVLTRQVTLEAAYVGHLQACVGDGCLGLLAAAGLVTAASAVVSGSIALVGNVVYWLERQGRCNPRPAAAPVGAPLAAASAAQ
jgi:hypothetical protein